MYTPDQILQAAQLIQPVLPQLLDPAIASGMAADLQSLLQRQDIDQIWHLLNQYPQTQRWRNQYLDPDLIRMRSNLKGDMVPRPSGLIYACPHCDYRDTIFLVGMDPDPCPKHPTAALTRL
jgi:hypothetical protein